MRIGSFGLVLFCFSALVPLIATSSHGATGTAEAPSAAVTTSPAARPPASAAEVAPGAADSAARPDEAKPKDVKPPELSPPDLSAAPTGVIVHFQTPRDKRPFSFYVPKNSDKDKAYPLLIECTGPGIGRQNIGLVWKLADKYDLIIASPDTYGLRGSPAAREKADATQKAWSRDAGNINVPAYTRNADEALEDLRTDAAAIDELVELLSRTYHVDAKLVVLTGYSGGAWTAYYVGVAAPLKYAGVCIRSGSFQAELLPKELARARKLPITVVIGDSDLESVLADTAAAEKFFQRNLFEKFSVERLPHSGHDNRPEVAANFMAGLKNELSAQRLTEARARWERFVKAGQSSLDRGDMPKARDWLTKAAEIEKEFPKLPPTATKLLKTIPSSGVEGSNK